MRLVKVVNLNFNLNIMPQQQLPGIDPGLQNVGYGSPAGRIAGQMEGLTGQMRDLSATPTQGQGDAQRQFMGAVENFKPQYQEIGRSAAETYAMPATQMEEYLGTDPMQ